MEDKNTIAYKQWLENLNEPAPEGAWESIADQLDIDQAWEGISESLDIDDVWHQVEQNLPQAVPAAGTTPTHLPKIFWAAAIIALFTLTTPVADQDGDEPGKEIIKQQDDNTSRLSDTPLFGEREKGKDVVAPGIKKEARQRITAAPAEDKPQPENQQQVVKSAENSNTNGVKQPVSVKRTETKQETNTTQTPVGAVTAVQLESISKQVVPAAKEQLPAVPVLQDQIIIPAPETRNGLAGMPQQIVVDSVSVEEPVDSTERITLHTEQKDSAREEKPVRNSRWQAGLIGAVKNTWLINPETSHGLKRTSLTSTKVTWGKEFGALVQRSVGRKSFIQAEYYFYSEIGQRYQEYIDALYQTKDIKLKYQKLQLVYRTRIFETCKLPPLYAAAGLHASKLSVASASIGGEGQVVTEEYMPWDYGVLAGLESEIFLAEKIILVPGIRASYGMRNIYGGNSQSPANLNKTNTATIGFSLALKYSFD